MVNGRIIITEDATAYNADKGWPEIGAVVVMPDIQKKCSYVVLEMVDEKVHYDRVMSRGLFWTLEHAVKFASTLVVASPYEAIAKGILKDFHTHCLMEKKLEVDQPHVIIDGDAFDEALKLLCVIANIPFPVHKGRRLV